LREISSPSLLIPPSLRHMLELSRKVRQTPFFPVFYNPPSRELWVPHMVLQIVKDELIGGETQFSQGGVVD
jgi:hypothetical protein